ALPRREEPALDGNGIERRRADRRSIDGSRADRRGRAAADNQQRDQSHAAQSLRPGTAARHATEGRRRLGSNEILPAALRAVRLRHRAVVEGLVEDLLVDAALARDL